MPWLPTATKWGDAYNGACSQSVEFVSGTGTVGIANAGLNRWGIAMRKGQTFEGRLYLRGSGDVVVALQSADGTKEYASQRITASVRPGRNFRSN